MSIKRYKKDKKYWICAFTFFSFNLILICMNEYQTIGALWLVILCLLPSLIVALQTSYLSLKLICAITLITQIITVPVFYLQPDSYNFGSHRPFNFTFLEALPVFQNLGLFLLLVATFIKLSERFVCSPVQYLDINKNEIVFKNRNIFRQKNIKYQLLQILCIFLLISVSLPIKFWMFKMGIGIVGITPPKLPYHLSGILFYFFSYFVPLSIGYLYIHTKRKSILLALFILIYALLIGLTSASKGIVLLTTAPIIAFAWFDRRWIILIISCFLAGLGVLIAATCREIIYIYDGQNATSFTELGAFKTLIETFLLLDWSPKMLFVFSNIASRIEGFQGLLLASQFSAEMVGGEWKLFFKAMYNGLVDIDHDAMHLEFIGYTIPLGFYNVSASLNAWVLMTINKNIMMVIPFVIYVTFIIILLEKMLLRTGKKYQISLPILKSLLFFVTIYFLTCPGTNVFIAILAILILFGSLPKFRLSSSINQTVLQN